MARIISILRGKNRIDCLLSGTIGDKVYFVRKGIQYTRSRPVHSLKPKTAAQLEQRGKFNAVMKFLQPLTVFLRVGFKNDKATMSPFNAAMSYDLKNALTGTYPDYGIDYSRVLVSRGKLPGALNPAIVSYAASEIEFSWNDNSSALDAMANDKAVLVVYNPVKQDVVYLLSGKSRIGGSQVIFLPTEFSGDTVHCYIAFQKANQTAISNSLYIGDMLVM